jgi:hypothetical protein
MSAPILGATVSACLGLLLVSAGAGAVEREPETAERCICVDGALLTWREGSTVGPPGRGRLDWPGAGPWLRCRPVPLPVGAPGEEAWLME